MVFPEGMHFFGDNWSFRANKLDFCTNEKGIHAVVYMISLVAKMISLVTRMWPIGPVQVKVVWQILSISTRSVIEESFAMEKKNSTQGPYDRCVHERLLCTGQVQLKSFQRMVPNFQSNSISVKLNLAIVFNPDIRVFLLSAFHWFPCIDLANHKKFKTWYSYHGYYPSGNRYIFYK